MRAITLSAACFFALAILGQAQAQFDVDPLFDAFALADDPVPGGGSPPLPTPDAVPEAPDLSDQPLPPVPRVPLPADLSDEKMLSDDLEPTPTKDDALYSDRLQDAAPDPPSAAPAEAEPLPLPPPSGEEAEATPELPQSIDFEKAFSEERLQGIDPAAAPAAPLPHAMPYHAAHYQGGGGAHLPPPVSSESYYRTPACYQHLWDGYAAERQRECALLHRHLHGHCKCFQPHHKWSGPVLYHPAPCGAAGCAPQGGHDHASGHHQAERPSSLNR